MALKTIEEQLADALDQVKAKSAKAAKTIAESDVTIEEKLATCHELIEGLTRCGKLTQLIRESSYYVINVPPTKKHNGVLDNGHATATANESDAVKLRVAAAAKAAFGLTEAEAKAFAEIDDTYEALRDRIINA